MTSGPLDHSVIGDFSSPPRRRWPMATLQAIFLLSVLIIWQGLVRRPTPKAFGISLNSVASPQPADTKPTLRVATFNIAGGVSPTDDRLDLDRTAKYLKGFDLVGLEEVHGVSVFDWRNQAQILGETLHLPWLFAPSETRWWHDSFGNGVLCDLPVDAWQRLPLSTSLSASNRSLLRFQTYWNNSKITVLVTHLDRHEDHDIELGAVLASFDDSPRPTLLLGDLNTDTLDPQLAKLRNDPTVTDVIDQTVGSSLPASNVDWIFARGLRCVSGGLMDNDASDHKLAWAELALPVAP
jgi:endonuclease/exonuclease/phosphatase family metal-dependent hydrolase